MAVFGFLGFYAVDLLLTRRQGDPRATAFLALACGLPAAASLGMLIISATKLGTACKLCIGIYVASTACLVGAIVLWRRAVRAPALEGPPASNQFLASMFGLGVLFVAVPVTLYFALAPDNSRFVGTCDALTHPDDSYGVMVPLEKATSKAVPALEILDPLCPACKAFEQRLQASSFAERLDRKAILFPLDTTCNWMITETTHPGACTVSEAVLCAGDRAPDVIAWAFEAQDRIRDEAKADPSAAARIVKQRFPDLASCVGSPEARSRLNKSLRWAVSNNIRVLTPQLFVDKVKLCDEDVDLGLDFALNVMLERHDHGALAASVPPAAASSKPVDAVRDTVKAPPAETAKARRKLDEPAATEVARDAGESAKPADAPQASERPSPAAQPDDSQGGTP
jgi:hypothetical protein